MTELRPRVVMIDGVLVPPEQAVVSVYDRGFLYGDSVFEVMRSYGRTPFALEEHVARLYASARRVFIDIPVPPERLAGELLAAAAACSERDHVVRAHVTRGSGPLGLDPSTARAPLRVALAEPLVLPPADAYRNGIAVVMIRTERTTDNTAAAGAKVANYLVSLLALREAHAAGAGEAIIVDGRGRVLEGTTSNLFVVQHDVLLTPPESEGILPGITRRHLLEAASSLGVLVRIGTLTRGDVLTADEAFVSSTVREVLPVVRVDGERIGDGAPGPVTRAVHRRFRQLGGLPGLMPWEEAPAA
jgi:branched-chain amino acid aminotransferase